MTTEPLWLEYARSQIGVAEIPGPKNSPTIMGWIKKLGAKVLGIQVNDELTPWCGTFAAQCVSAVGLKPPAIAVRASSWDGFGKACAPTVGCVLRFERPGGGHVGFYVGEDKTTYHVLGGNQGNCVSIIRIEKSRLVSSRWPINEPITTKPKIVLANGAVSSNEA